MDSIILKYKSNGVWSSISGTEIDWVDYYEEGVYNFCRVKKTGKVSEVISTDWNGKPEDVQCWLWDSYSVNFLCRESELNLLDNLKYCTDAKITQNDLSEYIFDLSIRNYLEITHEPVEITGIHNVTIKFRSNKVLINYLKDVISGYLIRFDNSKIIDTVWMSRDFKTILAPIFIIADQTIIDDEFTGVNIKNRITDKSSVTLRFYLSETDFKYFNRYLVKCDNISLYDTEMTNYNLTFNEQKIIESKNVGIDCYQIDISLIYENNVYYPFE
jgi:hypothetical protein